MRRWKIIKWNDRPKVTREAKFTCVDCMNESTIEVEGLPIAQVGSTIIFDIGKHSMPDVIECPHCRRRKENFT